MSSDGHRLRQSWSEALNNALTAFRGHLTSGSTSWRRVPLVSSKDQTMYGKGKLKAKVIPDPNDVVVHRKLTKNGDLFRVLLDIPIGEGTVDLDAWKAVLTIPELRQEWDPAAESSQLLEMFDPVTRVVKTKFTLGWPANPRDAVMIARTFNDSNTVIDISTSLPRSPDEPAYLRPAPPYVRSHVELFAWCVQLIHAPASPDGSSDAMRQDSGAVKLRLMCFWQHDLRAPWNLSSSASFAQQFPTMMLGLYQTVQQRGTRVPTVSGYGHGISIEKVVFDLGRQALSVDYAVIPDDVDTHSAPGEPLHGLDELHTVKEQRRLLRAIECNIPSFEGWDVRISTRASSEKIAQLPYTARLVRRTPPTDTVPSGPVKAVFQVKHTALEDEHSSLKVTVVLEHTAGTKGIRLNGIPQRVEDLQPADSIAVSASDQFIQDTSSALNVSIRSDSSLPTLSSDNASTRPGVSRTNSVGPRLPAAEKSILTRVRRNYIYFSSLLQEPEAKWKRNTEARGVSVTQLDSIDPTLVVYRAEATFVGVGLWDLYSTVVSPGARVYWDKQYEDATLLEDVNELTELWHFKSKPNWPTNGRDAILLKTVYKSPTTVHIFSFSVDEQLLFPGIPPADPNVIRTQVDLHGWAIEALSPTTTLLTLLEQSDPKGWSGKSTIPQTMINTVAGVGEYTIKCGGPPVMTRLSGAKATETRYDHARGVLRVEYEVSPGRPAVDLQSEPASATGDDKSHKHRNSIGSIASIRRVDSTAPAIECELRCDLDTWASSLDIVVDPPPQSITCLRRHRLSSGGGGLWLTVGHDILFTAGERLQAIVRRSPGKERGIVMVNGKRITVDVEELQESEIKQLSKQKRVKPVRVPLDQPPVLGATRRRKTELCETKEGAGNVSPTSSTVPKNRSPLANWFSAAYEQATSTTQQAVAALTPASAPAGTPGFSSMKPPMQYALGALAFAQAYHKGSYRDNWVSVSDKGLAILRRHSPEISPSVPVHRAERIIENVPAEDIAAAITNLEYRKQWDDRLESLTVLEEYGAECNTSFYVAKGGFPFRGRGFYLANLVARNIDRKPASSSSEACSPTNPLGAIFCASASFNPDSAAAFSPAKYNPYSYPIGRVYIDVWVMETLDPYTSENYAIPSTRCTRIVASDYSGSVPMAINSMINAALPRSVLALEGFMKGFSPLPDIKLPAAGLLTYSSDGSEGDGWTIKDDDPERRLLTTTFSLDTKTFNANILVSMRDAVAPAGTNVNGSAKDATESSSVRSDSPDTVRSGSAGGDGPPISPTATPERKRIHSFSTTTSPISTSVGLRSRSRDHGRVPSSLMALGKELMRPQGPSDFVIAELYVDTKLYGDNYDVTIQSSVKQSVHGKKLLPLLSLHSAAKTDKGLDTPQIRLEADDNAASAIPVRCAIYKITSSPLRSTGLTADQASGHLLRLTLPTSQFAAPTIDDPLTGEVRSAPSKPEWLQALEDRKQDNGLLVSISVSTPKPSIGVGTVSKKSKKGTVSVNGSPATVSPESELGRVGVEDQGLVRTTLIARVPLEDGVDAVPECLSKPLAIADDLFDDHSGRQSAPEPNPDSESSPDTAVQTPSEEHGDLTESPQPATPTDDNKAPADLNVSHNGLLSFLNTYAKPVQLLRLASTGSGQAKKPAQRTLKSSSEGLGIGRPTAQSLRARLPSTSSLVEVATQPAFSLSTLVVVAIIAFLLGSLLRSLLSPADFIYVVTDAQSVPSGVTLERDGNTYDMVAEGWREIKRLLELKYIAGGWDFQVAVVRRH